MTTFVPPNTDPTATGPVPGGEEAPTESHALATADHNEETWGMVHKHAEQNGGIKDLGWHEPPEQVPQPLVGHLPNEELWTLVRRFNKQMYHVKSVPHAPPGGLDFNVAAEDEFSPDKLRSNVERLYMTVIVGVVGAAKHIARLRSWKEAKRTECFFAAYFLVWAFDLVMPLMVATVIALVVVPQSRKMLFPLAPIALIDASTGGIKKPTAGMLGSHGSLTGAPEKHDGEAVEQEAHNFVASFGAIALSSAAGKGESGNKHLDEDSATEKAVPDPTEIATKAADAKKKGGGAGHDHDKAKKPMETAMWEEVRPVMHAVGDVADIWERFANALSPTPPFSRRRSRVVLASALVPVLLASLFASPYMVIKGTELIAGIAFFGDPLFKRGQAWLNANIPNWMKYLDIRNNLLKGVPTNAQLTLTLLRLGEARKAPLPPPPSSASADDVKPIDSEEHENLPADSAEIAFAMHPEPQTNGTHRGDNDEHKKHKPGHKMLSFFKGTTRASIGTALSTDPVKASMGSKKAQNRLGAVTSNPPPPSGPATFPARLRGKRGTVFVNPENRGVVAFAYDKNKGQPEFEVQVGEIVELKKAGGLGWKSKLAVGWSMDRDVMDGIEIVVRGPREPEGFKRWFLTAVGRRDELFNRLVAMGGQKWESW